MKIGLVWLALLALSAGLAGCHSRRGMGPSAPKMAVAGSAGVPADAAMVKARDAMLDKRTAVQDEHWAAAPARASSATVPAAVPAQGGKR